MSATPPTSSPPPGAQPIWGSYSASGQVARASHTATAPGPAEPSSRPSLPGFGDEPLTPLSQRLMHGVKFLSLLLILVLANSFLNSSEENPLNPIAAAAERTQSEPGARFTMKAIYTGAALPRPVVARGHGAYSSETGRSAMTLNMELPKVGRMTMEMVGDGTSMYVHMDGPLGQVPGGKEWIKVDPFGGLSEEELMVGNGDAESSLQMLSVTGGVQKLGREKVRGVATRRYRATVDLAGLGELLREEGKDEMADQFDEYVALAPAAPVVEVSIDGKGIVRRFRMVMEIPPTSDQPAMTMDMRMELFGFGADPQIELPDSSRVFDAASLEDQLD